MVKRMVLFSVSVYIYTSISYMHLHTLSLTYTNTHVVMDMWGNKMLTAVNVLAEMLAVG